MATLSYTIPDNKLTEYVAHYVYIFPNTEVDENGDLVYTDAQWVREHIMRDIRSKIVRGRNKQEQDVIVAFNADDIS